MKIKIDYEKPEFAGLSRNKIKKMCKKELNASTKVEWKASQREKKRQNKLERKKEKNELKKNTEILEKSVEKNEVQIGEKKLKEIVREKMKTAPKVIIDCTFEKCQDEKVK